MTDNSSTPNQAHTPTLRRPVKYGPVMRQNCRPQVV